MLYHLDVCLWTKGFNLLTTGTVGKTSQILRYCFWINFSASPISIWEGMKEGFYLTTHSTHFIYGYMASDIW